jgi:hypothetical protein
MSDKPPQTETDLYMRKFREIVTATIALIVVLVYPIGMVIVSVNFINTPEKHDQLKDLFLIVNPLLGFVLGYYFNKTSTEARAENAESTAKTAVTTAQQASMQRERAQETADKALQRVEEAKGILREMGSAVEELDAARLGTLGDEELAEGTPPARRKLDAAWEHAKRILDS